MSGLSTMSIFTNRTHGVLSVAQLEKATRMENAAFACLPGHLLQASHRGQPTLFIRASLLILDNRLPYHHTTDLPPRAQHPSQASHPFRDSPRLRPPRSSPIYPDNLLFLATQASYLFLGSSSYLASHICPLVRRRLHPMLLATRVAIPMCQE